MKRVNNVYCYIVFFNYNIIEIDLYNNLNKMQVLEFIASLFNVG